MEHDDTNIPSITRCYHLMADMEMMDHIVAHSMQVSRVALLITDSLNDGGARLDRDLVRVAALLHDITKTRSLRTDELHAQTGEEYLIEQGYPRVGTIVGQHVRLKEYDTTSLCREEEVVNYADKRVLHDEIVSLEERMRYILEKYGSEEASRRRILWLWHKTKELEEKFFSTIPFSPGDLAAMLRDDDLSRQLMVYHETCRDWQTPSPLA